MQLRRKANYSFEANRPQEGLGRKSLHSGFALIAARGLNMFVQLGSTIVLARLLSPHDYGVVAMVLALVGFAPMLIDLGTTDAIVQKAHVTHADASSLFWLKVGIAALLMLLLIGGSGLIATFYNEPALTEISIAFSLLLLASALSSQHLALMRRSMQFQQMALIEISSNIVSSIIAIAMAFTGWGYWALVAKPILTSGLAAAAAWIMCPWVPGRPQLTAGAKEMVGFGIGVTGFTITDYLAQSADRIALGYFFGASPLGYFQNTVLLYNNLLSLFTQGLHDVAVSALSKLRENQEELKRSWAAALSSLTFFSALAFAGLAVTGQDFVVMLLGQKWEPAGPLLAIFAVRGIAHVVERTLGWLHVAAGRSDRWMRWGIFSAFAQLAAVVVGLPFGLAGVATSHAVATFCLFVPALAYAGQPLGISVRDVIRTVGPQISAALITVATGAAVQHLFLHDAPRMTRFIISVVICIAVYLSLTLIVFRLTGPLRHTLSLLRDVLRLQRTP